MRESIDLSKFDNSDFDRGSSKAKEILWLIVRSLIFASWLPIPSVLKVVLLRLFGAEIGENVVIRSRVSISFPWRFSCGDNVWIGDGVTILSLARVSLASNTCISQKAFLCSGSHDFDKKCFDLVTKPIVIESNSWIGAQCFVGPGVRVYEASRCLAGAVVVKDVPPGATVGGVPAVRVE